MNKHILLVIKWLNDKDSVTDQELADNKKSAYAADNAADNAAYNAAYNTAYNTAYAEKWVNRYLERTGENKQDYIDALAESKPVYTQAMSDEGILPVVGMEVMTPWGVGKVELIYMDDVCCSNEYGIGVDKINEIKPITQLIDGKAYQFQYEGK